MRLHEYQAKQIFSKHGIRVARGELATSVEDVRGIAEELGGKVVLKSQVLVGGRGKAGGIKKAYSVEEAVEKAKEMFGSVLKGHIVEKIYVEEMIEVQREMYAGLTIDRANKGIAAILSSVGGMDIEEIAVKHPEKIARIAVNPKWGLWDYQIRELLLNSQMPREYWKEVASILKTLYRIMVHYEAELVEINPLVVTPDGLVAADARLNIDDSALFRHRDLEKLRDYTEADQMERIAMEKGLNYVKLDGNVGVLANGAGMAMATMDLIYIYGGKPANFLDIGGGASAEVVREAINLILSDKNVKVVFINIFGGITRCDEVAKGLKEALADVSTPVVVRLAGTNEEEGRKIMDEFAKDRPNFHIVETMEEGAEKAVKLAEEV
ncbi:ADP-forming succinate--CoA ligase subunit beta [Archaeoglobus fulgidus]|uniref:Succinate--CoA ligase [ADP-forming] subunit beta 2 n=3 Tax=Archaeoglobus fulgidus TaxID=2234 RepID=SUCC2_ARCFU|nr:ADP-forming succinate--CoA ligase subunit beta [Archaeoglobus fulgidus]O28097.1 RecName: Full=Succinate--CoA ligase [ADP-forming] subunit beta 2; AltName: Full=Succinyl-CoA synthetase subunit beta 2; Short=SCS-beta 2 [Archaeoglobus fulgidus DSM 4304]AAB89066.1 succinyl-CoA synthetase, beta subunit (sucC-2) [Archaeoglobus fulgidus DSM 4304]AIG99174.1 succinyl-CoA synthetase, beta subunit [Archaeoglobus fulgidus DSM 8774]KUJ93336.1 MAG: Succinyl-CoA ligase subunit beta-2 [Archaeoglobus fulgidu